MNLKVVACTLVGLAWIPMKGLARGENREESTRSAEGLWVAGERAFEARAYAEARACYQSYLESFGAEAGFARQAAFVRARLAHCHIRERSFDLAGEILEVALERAEELPEPWQWDLLYWKGIVQMEAGAWPEAQASMGKYYRLVPTGDPRRSEAAVLYGTLFLLRKQFEEATSFFESRIEEYEGVSREVMARMMTLQLHALLHLGRLDDAVRLQRKGSREVDAFTQIIGWQGLTLDLGSRLLGGGRYHDALACFQSIRDRDSVLGLQEARLKRLKQRMRALQSAGDQEAALYKLEGIRHRMERELGQFREDFSHDAALRYRMASAYMGLERYREAALLLEFSLKKSIEKPNDIVEQASLTLMQCWMQEGAWERAAAAAELYESQFGENGRHRAEMFFLKGQALEQARDHAGSLQAFRRCLALDPKGAHAPQASLLVGLCLLNEEQWDKAIAVFEEQQRRYPKAGNEIESALYWKAMALSLASRYRACLDCARDYLECYPEGRYREDATFREAFARHSLSPDEEAISLWKVFIEAHPESAYVDEARLLLGDAYLERGLLDQGIACLGAISAKSVKFHEEGIFKIGKALRLSERYEDMEAHFSRFVAQHHRSARLAEALHWLAWLQKREGDQAGARAAYWSAWDRLANEPGIVSLVPLSDGLQKLYGGDEREALLVSWKRRVERARHRGEDLAALRCQWARAGAMKRRRPVQAAVALTRLAGSLDARVHDARILSDVAGAFRQLGSWPEAAQYYAEVVRWHPRSPERELAEEGLARAAMRREDFELALYHWERAGRRPRGHFRAAEIVLAKAECLAAMNKHAEAIGELKALLASRESGSHDKAMALLHCGQWLAATGEAREALAYFERVYLTYGRYPKQVAAAYWARGQVLESLGKVEAAREVYVELAGREDLAATLEHGLASERLR